MFTLNPYATPETASPKGDIPTFARSVFLSISSVVLGLLVTIAMFSTKSSFAPTVAEFGIELPLAASISCSMLFPLLLLVLTVIALAVSLLPKFHSLANRWNAVHIVVSILAFSFYVWGMFSPLTILITGLSR